MRRRKSLARSRAARKAWDTRIRRQGVRQVTKAIIKRNPTISAISFTKTVACGTMKAIKPRGFRNSKLAKTIDRL